MKEMIASTIVAVVLLLASTTHAWVLRAPLRRSFAMRSNFMDEFDTDSNKPTPKKDVAPAPPAPVEAEANVEISGDKIVAIEETAPPAPVTEMVEQAEISNSMKDKLRAELEAQGANPNKAGANPILIISGVVALLVIVGGSGFFY